MKKMLSLLLVLCFAMGCLAGCGGGGGGSTDNPQGGGTSSDPIVVKWNTVVAESHPGYALMLEAEKRIEEASDGRLDVQCYPSSQLGADREAYEALGLGELEIHYSGSFVLGNFTDKTKFWTLPFFFSSGYDALYEFFDTYGEEIAEGIAEDCGIYPVWTINGCFSPLTKDHEVRSPADMAGVQYRVHELDMFVDAYTLLGAIPVVMNTSEVYTGLQQGTIDGVHSELQMIQNSKFYEVCKYYTANNMAMDMSLAGVSTKFLDTLPEDLKEILLENLQWWADAYIDEYMSTMDDTYALLEEEGLTVSYLTDEEMQVFIDAVQPLYEEFAASGIEPNFEEYYAFAQELNEKYSAQAE